jgi:5'-3' exonuclease
MEAVLTEDDIDLVRGAMEDASKDLLQKYGAKQEELYERFEKELKEIQKAIQFSLHSTHCTFFLSQIVKLGDEPSQLRRLADAIEDRDFRRSKKKRRRL